MVIAEERLGLKALKDFAVNSDPRKDKSKACGELDCRSTACVIEVGWVCLDLFNSLSEHFNSFFNRVFQQKLKGFKNCLELVRCVCNRVNTLAEHYRSMNGLRVVNCFEPNLDLSNELSKNGERVYLLFAHINLLDVDQHSRQNHGEIVFIFHLECWTEDNSDQNFDYFKNLGAGLCL